MPRCPLVLCLCYSLVEGEKMNLEFFLWNYFDRYLWLKAELITREKCGATS